MGPGLSTLVFIGLVIWFLACFSDLEPPDAHV